ncbi:hypothetical protein ESA94_20395 [Lacibacter luteus]|uniref:DDE transposase family protein n=1 Tax=Lacibacter luteus TaxID=2508719 RepID=A0A4Q1CDG5_9BACT|nr:hypothetical protein [Lacibacter luteus]RXK57561.1 hypothetical protein ESA94_20395 [Lacibacter luteus]
MSAAQTIADKQFLAKILFTTQKLDQKIVAKRVGISETTMSKWVNEFGWKNLRNRLLVGKEQILSDFYEELEEINESIKDKPKGKRYADTKLGDVRIKLTASIRNLETEMSIADIVGAGMRFIKFLQYKGDMNQVNDFTELWNDFIHAELKK